MKTISRLKYSILLAFALAALFVLLAPNSHADGLSQEENTILLRLEKESLLSKTKFQGDWKLELGGQSFEEATDDEKSASVALRLRPKYRLLENLIVKGDLRLKSESGRIQSRFYPGSENMLQLNNATIEFYPIPFLLLEGGIVNQGYIGQELLFSQSRSFAGFKEGLIFGPSDFKTSLILQQSIPSSTSLNAERVEKEETPSFLAQTLQLEINRDILKGVFGGSLFQYNNLPSKVAYESYVNGNTIDGSDSSLSRFVYDFAGYGLNSKLDVNLSESLSLVGALQLIENTKAPSGNSRAQMLWLGPALTLGDTKWNINYGKFFAESDVAPAYYMNLNYGGTNRVGDFSRIEVEFTKFNFKLLAQYALSETLNERVHQDRRTSYLVRLETLYVSF
ncbi:MAG: hypothetical protein H6625_11925 [Bdellovibrionaceae bacterium]|nr:hypothetical protein [Pseudobdellovibrionaceae bacterium]